jgi:hypothetical protein
MAPNANLETDYTHVTRDDLIAELVEARELMSDQLALNNAQTAQALATADRYRALVYGMYAVLNDFTARSLDTSLPEGEGAAMDAQLTRMATWASARDLLYAKLRELR